MGTLRISRTKLPWILLAVALLSLRPAVATDGQPILDLGIMSWLEYHKKQLLVDVAEVVIHDHKMHAPAVTVSLYQAVIFENRDDFSHRLVFLPDIDNKMETAYTSAVIRSEERWGAEFHGFGVFPFHCSIHPEERGKITVKLTP